MSVCAVQIQFNMIGYMKLSQKSKVKSRINMLEKPFSIILIQQTSPQILPTYQLPLSSSLSISLCKTHTHARTHTHELTLPYTSLFPALSLSLSSAHVQATMNHES